MTLSSSEAAAAPVKTVSISTTFQGSEHISK